ncbi:MAG: apolipoprotein N-acyltransferase, partial [Nitrospinae bacterium]|nr:apolipoprotein N-acyltransferase [Nitrospinota bacterium]
MKFLTLKETAPLLLSLLSGVLLALTFPLYDFESLAWLAFIPLFSAIEGKTPQRAALLGFITGMAFYSIGLSWVNNTLINYGNLPMVLSFAVLLIWAAYTSIYLTLFCYFLNRVCKNKPVLFFLFAPVLWVSLEYIRSTHSEYGFSWLGLGYSQYKTLPVIQMAEITGVYGVSWLIMLVNAGLYLTWKSWQESNNNMVLRFLSVTVLVLVLWVGLGISALNRAAPKPNFKVALIQGNVEQAIKWNPVYQLVVMNKYRNLTLQSMQSKPQLVVWPETAMPFYYTRHQSGTLFVQELARETKTPILFGNPRGEQNGSEVTHFNSAYMVTEKGETKDRYDKMHLVPFGEFVPFKSLLFFVEKLVPMIGDFGRGEEATVFDVAGQKAGVSICYEITFPDLMRQAVKNGAGFLVNISNDAWFGKSAATYQQMAMGALRAVENRVPLVRAANTGVSGTITANGEVKDETELFVDAARTVNIAP